MSFSNAFSLLIKLEGGIVTDSGGLTKFGISKKQYPNVDIANLTIEAAEAIYLRDYWQKYHCGMLPEGLDICLFCVGVDTGMGTAIEILQHLLEIPVDGIIGNMTLQNILHYPSLNDLIINFLAKCSIHYSQCEEFSTDGFGWFRRLFIISEEVNVYKY
jgi:lysozyme family protein